jgi:hypothetical protein
MAATLIGEARAAGLVLYRVGEHIHIDSPLGASLSDELRTSILAHREELLAFLAWRDVADELVLSTIRRIAAAQPAGRPARGPAWREAEKAIDAAYRENDTEALRSALARYEQFALTFFADPASRKRGPTP